MRLRIVAAMVTLAELRAAAPTIAAFVEERIEATGPVPRSATTRADGWPRVSPLELSVVRGPALHGQHARTP